MKLFDFLRFVNVFGGVQYWSPIVLDRLAHRGASGSSGGLSG